MEKTNLSKRVVAGTLALLTVFGSAPASLQGVFAPSALTANAADAATYGVWFYDAKDYIKSIKIGTNAELTADNIKTYGVTSATTKKGDAITIKSSVPLDITKYVAESDYYVKKLPDGTDVPAKFDEASAPTWPDQFKGENAEDVNKKIAAVLKQEKDAIDTHYKKLNDAIDTDIAAKQAARTEAWNSLYGAEGTQQNPRPNSLYANLRDAEAAIAAYNDQSTGYAALGTQLEELNGDEGTKNALSKLTQDSYAANTKAYYNEAGENVDPTPENIAKCEAGTDGWYVVTTYTNAYYQEYGDAFPQLIDLQKYIDVQISNLTSNRTSLETAYKKAMVDLYGGDYDEGTNTLEPNPKNPADGSLTKQISSLTTTMATLDSEISDLQSQKTANNNAKADAYTAAEAKGNLYTVVEDPTGYVPLDTAKDSYKETVSGDEYTYEFVAPEVTGMGTGIVVKARKAYAGFEQVVTNDQGTFDQANDLATGVKINDISVSDAYNPSVGNFVVNSTVTVTANDPFELTVDKNSASAGYIKPVTSYDAEKNVFKATFIMPESADETKNVMIYVEKVAEEYEYTVKDGKLIASTKSGSVSNAEAASVIVVSKKPDANTKSKFVEDDKGNIVYTPVANGGSVDYNDTVILMAKRASKLTNGGITPLTTAASYTFDNNKTPFTEIVDGDNDYETVKVTAPGEYKVAYEVTDKAGNKKELNYNFTIKNPKEFTAADVKLTLTGKGKKTDATGTSDVNINVTKDGVVDGVTEFTLPDKYTTLDGKATIEDSNIKINGLTLSTTHDSKDNTDDPAAKKYIKGSVDGYVTGSTLNNVYSFTISISDSVYGKYDIPIQWKLTGYTEQVSFKNDHDSPARSTLNISDDKMDTLKEKIYETITDGRDVKADIDDLQFEYVEGVGATVAEDELDARNEGLPKTAKSGDKFTVYVIYNDEARVSVLVNVETLAHLKVDVDDSILDITFGDSIDTSKYTLTNTDTKAVVSDVKADLEYTIKVAELDKDGKPQLDDKGKYKTVKNAEKVAGTDFYGAGTYVVVFSNKTANAVNGYDFAPSDEKILVINKKEITSDMVTISAVAYTGSEHNIPNEGTVTVVDNAVVVTKTELDGTKTVSPMTVTGVQITEGPKKTEVGRYDATVEVKDNANYTGKTTAKWSIVNKVAKANNAEVKGLVNWNNEKTTIYDNGRIHFQIDRVHNDSLIVGNAKKTVKQFGVIIEKNGKFNAPKVYGNPTTDELNAVNAELQLNNGYTTGKYVAGASDAKVDALKTQNYLVNIKVKDVHTGIWARPYILLDDGTVSYGDTKYINLQQWAQEDLQLTLARYTGASVEEAAPGMAKRMADLPEQDAVVAKVRNGYLPDKNKFYAYAEFTELDKTANAKSLTVSDFGVVIDKTGTVNATDVDDKLVLGNGFIEGHYNPNNAKLGKNQYAASISPKDSVTGVWVRAYVDLGNDLVVYTKPVYYKSASEYYSASKPKFTYDSFTEVNGTTTGKIQISVVPGVKPTKALTGVDDTKIKTVKAGVVIDKTGETSFDAAKTGLILDKGFVEGKKTSGLETQWTYTAKITPETGKKLVARSYAIYDINGVNVTVYGGVVEYDPSKKDAYNRITASEEGAFAQA